MNRPLVLFLALMFLFPLAYGQKLEEDAPRMLLEQAMQRSDLYRANDVRSFRLDLETHEYRQEKELESNQIGLKVLKGESLNKAMIRYRQPESLKGTTYIVHMPVDATKPEGIWVYLPSFKQTKRLSALKAKKSLPDAVSSFSLFDRREIDFDDYHFSRKQSTLQEEQGFLILELLPKKKSGKHLNVWITKETGLLAKVVGRNSDKRIIEEIVFEAYASTGSVQIPTHITRHDVLSGKVIKVRVNQFELNQKFSSSEFEVSAIENPF